MSDYYSHLVYGLKVTKDDLENKLQVRGCHHPETPKNFCAECGAPMFKDNTALIDWDNATSMVKVFEPWDDSREKIIGFELLRTDTGIAEVPTITSYFPMRDKIKVFCEERGIVYKELHIGSFLFTKRH